MFGLPPETEVYKFIPKNAIYTKFGFTAAQKTLFDEDIKKISIIHEISDNTLHISGSEENTFFILEIQLKRKNYDSKNIERLTKLIDRNLLLALTFENQVRFAVFKTVLHQSEWKDAQDATVTLNGHDYNTIWENVIKDVCSETDGVESFSWNEDNTLEQNIERKIQSEKILKEIKRLKAKLRKEKQFNRKVEINGEIRKLEEMVKHIWLYRSYCFYENYNINDWIVR